MHCYVIQSGMLAMFLPFKASVSVLTSPVLAINTFIQHVCMYVYMYTTKLKKKVIVRRKRII